LSLLLLAACSQEEVATPASDSSTQFVVIEDPLDGVLKSTDGVTPEAPQDRLARLAEVLQLDEDQLAALTVAYTDFRDGIALLKAQVETGEITRADARAAAAILREAFEAELSLILTQEQWDLLQDMRQQRDRLRERVGDYVERWTEWLTEIGADEDQTAAVFEALGVLRTEVQDLREQVRTGTLTPAAARESTAALRIEFDAALQTILTEEQYIALQNLRPDCIHNRDNDQE